MSQGCWGPSPEDYAAAWKWRADHSAKVKAVQQEMGDALKAILRRRRVPLSEFKTLCDADNDYIRDEAFRAGLWSWLNRGLIEMDAKNRVTYNYRHPDA